MEAIEEEADFRSRILATRRALVEESLAAARKLDQEEDAAALARRFRSRADRQIQILLEADGNVPALKFASAEIRIALGDFSGAQEMLYEIKRTISDSTHQHYVRASKMISETYLKLGQCREAVVYPHRMLIAGPAWEQKHWPEMRAFLERCYKGGAERPKPIEVEAGPDGQPRDPMEIGLEDLMRRYGLTRKSDGVDDPGLTHNERRLFKLLRDGVAHLQEYQKRERFLMAHVDSPDAARLITPAFRKRHEVLRDLVAAVREAWRQERDLDRAIVEYKGWQQVPRGLKEGHAASYLKVETLKKALAETQAAWPGD